MEMVNIKSNLCPHCSGRGFNWQTGKIVSRRDGSEVATTYKKGPNCEMCDGTGQVYFRLSIFGWLVVSTLALVAAAFIVSPLLH